MSVDWLLVILLIVVNLLVLLQFDFVVICFNCLKVLCYINKFIGKMNNEKEMKYNEIERVGNNVIINKKLISRK